MPALKRDVNFENSLKVLRRSGRPAYLPFYEHIASPEFIARRTGTEFHRWGPDTAGYWETYVEFWLGLGFDCIPMEIPPNWTLPAGHGGLSEESEARVCIRSREDFERFDWPEQREPIAFRYFEKVARLLPKGVKIVGGTCAGPYEWGSWMMGTVGMSYLIADEPELVGEVFRRIGATHLRACQALAQMDAVGALRQGDDLGFKTSTFLPPERLREWIIPIYRQMAALAHAAGKPFILHSCGNLAAVYEDLIAGAKIDAKHSFEDTILPVEDFQAQYRGRVTALGGLDVDMICRSSPDEVRAYARRKIEKCFADGHWALGTGNSLTNYMPVENYLAVLEVGMGVRA
jgi:uroporphyrinogen decarboxylase